MTVLAHPRRLAAALLVAGAGLGLVAPQWASASRATSDPTPASSPVADLGADALAAADAAVRSIEIDLEPTTPAPADATEPAPAPAAEPAPPPVAPAAPAPVAPAATPTPAPAAAPADDVAPVAATEAAPTTATITVTVATTEGATRSASLRTSDGAAVAGPVAVDGSPITFTDLAPGAYDLFVEQFADGGGTFLTRTPITVDAGDDVAVTCDPSTLDCTV